MSAPDFAIRDATLTDAVAVAALYNHYIATSTSTFEVEPVDTDTMASRMRDLFDGGYPYLVAEKSGVVVGYAYAALFERLQDFPLHAALALIALPNPGSVALHEGFGFTRVGLLPEVGRKFNRWIDVGYWHRRLP